MDKTPTSDFIYFGTVMRYVQDADAGDRLGGDGYVQTNLSVFLDRLEQLKLETSVRMAMLVGLPQLKEEFDAAVEADPDARVSEDQHERLQDAMRQMWNCVIAESLGKYSFVVSDKRLDPEKLIEKPGALFPPGIYDALPELARYDFAEAGKCIAFDRPTAAGFHLMRGTESVLRDFYCATVKQNRVDPQLWGPMLQHMRGRSKPPPAAMLDLLDSIREHYRNPTQHPEATYDIHEAQDLFGLSVDAVSRLTRNLPT